MEDKNYQVCNDCCHKLNLKINSYIESRCHRKYCDLCGYSVDDDLSLIDKINVDNAISIYNTKLSLPLFS